MNDAPRRRLTAAERDERAREALAPLSPGERPLPLRIAALVAALVGVAVLVGALTVGDLKARGGSLPAAIRRGL